MHNGEDSPSTLTFLPLPAVAMFRRLQAPVLDLMHVPEFRFVVLGTILLVLVVIAVYCVLRVRGRSESDTQGLDEHLSIFREMHEQGTLRDFEFRRVKSELSRTIQGKLNQAGDED